MDRFNSNEELEATPLSIAKEIIYSDGIMDEKVKQIESAITEAKKLAISGVSDQRELLINFLEYLYSQNDRHNEINSDEFVDEYLINNR